MKRIILRRLFWGVELISALKGFETTVGYTTEI